MIELTDLILLRLMSLSSMINLELYGDFIILIITDDCYINLIEFKVNKFIFNLDTMSNNKGPKQE